MDVTRVNPARYTKFAVIYKKTDHMMGILGQQVPQHDVHASHANVSLRNIR
jgi:hypothetical protein